MSEIVNDKAKQAQELRDMQESYRRRKKAMQDEGEQSLQSLREETKKKVEAENRDGAAAVSHVRNNSKLALQQAKEDTDLKATYERKNVDKRLTSVRNESKIKEENLKENVAHKQRGLSDALDTADKRTAEVVRREAEETAKIRESQMEQRQKAVKIMGDDLTKTQKTAAEKKNEILANNRAENEALQAEQKAKTNQARTQAKQSYEQQRKLGQEQLAVLNKENETRFQEQQKQYTEQRDLLRRRADAGLREVKQTGDDNLNRVAQENKAAIEAERTKGIAAQEETRNLYAGEVERLHKKGDAGLTEQQAMYKQKTDELAARHKSEVESLKIKHETEIKDKNQQYQTQSSNNDVLYKEQLIQQRSEFADAQKKGSEAFANAIRAQKENYSKSLMREKAEIAKNVGKYQDKQADPFYTFTHADSKIEENENYYFVNSAVPEHEKDNVKMHVKNGKVVVQGTRRFEDKLDDGEAKLTTNNFQTFREELPLEKPVHEKLAERFYSNGVLTLKIPKA